jgi:hypothetical protein
MRDWRAEYEELVDQEREALWRVAKVRTLTSILWLGADV